MTTYRLGSGGPWEERYGYCRVVAVGPSVWVSGCTNMEAGDAAAQARGAFAVAIAALARVGAEPRHVVRTRMFVVDRADADAVASVHGELFGAYPPASTLVVVAGLLEPAMRVEVEVEAHLDAT